MPCVKSGARAGSLYRNLVAHALTLGASGDRAPVRQQPCSGRDFFIVQQKVSLCFVLLYFFKFLGALLLYRYNFFEVYFDF